MLEPDDLLESRCWLPRLVKNRTYCRAQEMLVRTFTRSHACKLPPVDTLLTRCFKQLSVVIKW
jgi:hypothetical protein